MATHRTLDAERKFRALHREHDELQLAYEGVRVQLDACRRAGMEMASRLDGLEVLHRAAMALVESDPDILAHSDAGRRLMSVAGTLGTRSAKAKSRVKVGGRRVGEPSARPRR